MVEGAFGVGQGIGVGASALEYGDGAAGEGGVGWIECEGGGCVVDGSVTDLGECEGGGEVVVEACVVWGC